MIQPQPDSWADHAQLILMILPSPATLLLKEQTQLLKLDRVGFILFF